MAWRIGAYLLGIGLAWGYHFLAHAQTYSVLSRQRPSSQALTIDQLSHAHQSPPFREQLPSQAPPTPVEQPHSQFSPPGITQELTQWFARGVCHVTNSAAPPPRPNSLTRAELAVMINHCLDTWQSERATAADLVLIQQFTQAVAPELASVQSRFNQVEERAAILARTQFSPTTKLQSSVLLIPNDLLAGHFSNPTGQPTGQPLTTNLAMNYRTRLILDTSFSGRDLLRVRLQAANFPNYSQITGTNMSRLAVDNNTNDQFEMNQLFYRMPIASRGQLTVDIVGGSFDHSFKSYNPLLSSSEKGTISRFGRFNPVYDIKGGTGLAFSYDLISQRDGQGVTLNIGYLAGRSPNNTDNRQCSTSSQNTCFNAGYPGQNPSFGAPTGGLTGTYGAMTQLDLRLLPNLALGLNYVRSFGIDVTGGSGSSYAQNPFGSNATTNFRNLQGDSVGLQFTTRLFQQLQLSGWVGYSHLTAVQGPAQGQTAQVINYAVTFGIPDLWQEGDVIGLIFGQPPQLISTDHALRPAAFNSYHLEAFYRMQLSPNISLTPGIFTVLNPNSNAANPPLVLGILRTTFTF